MLNAHTLLYILPDVAYIAELLPGKKAHTFSIQNFRQINGQFMDDNVFLADNILKLFEKLEKKEYRLVLPDFLFTNTIVSVKETDNKKVDEHVTSKLLPDLGLSKETHQIAISILTTFKGEAKVQLSAIEHSLLVPVKQGATAGDITLTSISPLSWTVKSVVSLEPSITLLQMGATVTTALHYIGVDQTNEFPLEDIEAIAESIKTLKGSEPNIQTLYLVTNSVVESKLKELLSNTIPLQQLAPLADDDAKIPPYVQAVIEAGMKTLSISDYPVPSFTLEPVPSEESSEAEASPLPEPEQPTTALPEPTDVAELPQPATASRATTTVVSSTDTAPAMTDPKPTPTVASEDLTETQETESTVKSIEPETTESAAPAADSAEPIVIESADSSPQVEAAPAADSTPQVESAPETTSSTPPAASVEGGVDLAQFAVQGGSPSTSDTISTTTTTTTTTASDVKPAKGGKSMLKIALITVLAFAATVAVGVGVGVGLVSYSGSKTPPPPTQVVEDQTATPTVEVTPEPTASPAAELALEDLSVLVVNATTTAGLAGTVSEDLEAAGVGSASAVNAKGTYTDATSDLVLMPEDNDALVAQLSEASGRDLEYAEGFATEDSTGTYDAVIVLTQ